MESGIPFGLASFTERLAKVRLDFPFPSVCDTDKYAKLVPRNFGKVKINSDADSEPEFTT